MPAIALSPKPIALLGFRFDNGFGLPTSQGQEGRRVESLAREVAGHWRSRPSCLVEPVTTENDFSYKPIPLKVAGSVQVKYRLGGRLQPLPYPAD